MNITIPVSAKLKDCHGCGIFNVEVNQTALKLGTPSLKDCHCIYCFKVTNVMIVSKYVARKRTMIVFPPTDCTGTC